MEFIPIVSAVVGAIGQISQASAGAASQRNAAAAADYNATVNWQNAENARLAANANEEQERREAAMKKGSQIASLAENGIDLSSGTGTDLVNQSSLNTEMNALNIRYQGALQARAYESGATLDDFQARNARSNADSIETAGYIGAAGSVLSGVGNYYGAQETRRLRQAQGKYYGVTS